MMISIAVLGVGWIVVVLGLMERGGVLLLLAGPILSASSIND